MTGHHCKRCGEPYVWQGVYCEDCGWVDCTGIQTELEHVVENHPSFEGVELVRDDSDGVVLEAEWSGHHWHFDIAHDPIVHDHIISARRVDGGAVWSPGSVDYKYDAIAYVLETIGVIEDCGDVQPTDDSY